MPMSGAMRDPVPTAKGKLPVLGYRLFWESFGSPDRGTVLCLHGGPGVPHGYLTCLADLTSFGYRIVFYVQLRVAKSDRPRGTSLFTIERAVEEAEAVRKALALGRIHLPAISVPTLITGRKYDEITPRIARSIHRGIPGSKIVIFPENSHLPMLEERERYMRTVGNFLRRHDGR